MNRDRLGHVMRVLVCLSLACCVSLAGCRDTPTNVGGADAAPRPPVPDPELVLPVGTPAGLDIGTWNIQNFPMESGTVELVASLIASMEIDLIGVEEIADVAAFERMMAYLPEYDYLLSSHTYGNGQYQKVGFIYRPDLLEPGPATLLFDDDTYAFPRPPMQVDFRVLAPGDGSVVLDFTAIVVHLKAGGDDTDRNRRRAAVEDLDAHVRTQIANAGAGAGDEDIVLLGDFNENLDSAASLAVWAPFMDASDVYQVHSLALPAGSYSYVPWASLIDHVVTTRSLEDELGTAPPAIPPLQVELENYITSVSDHLPVVIAMEHLLD